MIDPRWIVYKNTAFNINNVERLEVENVRNQKGMSDGDGVDTEPKKPWVLKAGYRRIDAFESQGEATQVMRDIIGGKYDAKEPNDHKSDAKKRKLIED